MLPSSRSSLVRKYSPYLSLGLLGRVVFNVEGCGVEEYVYVCGD